MKISRIDVIGQNGNDGEIYDHACFGRDWLMEHGIVDCGEAEGDRGAQGRVPGEVQGGAGAGQLDLLSTEGEGADVGGKGVSKAPGAGGGGKSEAEPDDGEALK